MEIINDYLRKIKSALDFSMTKGNNFLKEINHHGESKTFDSPDSLG